MTKSVEITFPKLNHFWLDSGLLGLAIMLRGVNCDIEIAESDIGLTLKGPEDAVQDALKNAYGLLVKHYYDLSTKKQKDDTTSYNFYYDSKKDKFVAFPKKKSVGIAEFIFNKAPRPTGTSVKWTKEEKREILINGKMTKRNRGILPPSHVHLQKRMDEFLDENGLDVTTSGLLVDGPNAVCPKVTIAVKATTKVKGHCYLCGENSPYLEDAGQTIFPFITGSSGLLNFNSMSSKPEKVCWKCAFLGKFVTVNGFYLTQGDKLLAFFPYSVSFEKMLDVYAPLQDARYNDPNLFKNFQHPLGFENYADGYFQKPFEVTFAFLYTLYKKVILHQKNDEDEGILNWEEMCNLFVSKAPLEFVVLHAESKGQTSMGKMVWPFRDSVYFFRLIKELEKGSVNIKEVMRFLIDFTQKNENRILVRNRVCERILKKRSTLDLIESHAFSIDNTYFKPLFDFAIEYEPIVRKEESGMNIEEQETAVTLGKRIGMVVGKEGKKGDLFRLRKARRKTDFLNELNRLQFKCKLTVPPDVYEGKLSDSNFIEFKQFCMIAALNSFHAATQSREGGQL
ncbi:hypothetical protein M1N53_01885 [Thermodesulfovibrionales bacterium]|nr:hypothetical protein [Thermodesulfovibrionales bacterium]